MIAPDEESESTPDLKGRCFVLVHERYERPIYAMLDPDETVEDLKRDVETVRPGCRVMLPTTGEQNGRDEPRGANTKNL